MAFIHQPLDEAALSAGVRKLVGAEAPPPVRLMAARGLAPLPPRDLLTALYQFWAANEPKLGEEAAKTVVGLPPAILNGALDDPGLPAGVLDFLGRKLARNEAVLERIVRHPAVSNDTLAGVARVCPESICDLLAENQTRWLAFPKIVESLYQNPNCRMSVVHRMLEFAVRQGVDLELPNIEEIKAELTAEGASGPDPERDAIFRQAAGVEVLAQHERELERMEQTAAHEDPGAEDPLSPATALVDDAPAETLDLDALLAEGSLDDLTLPLEAAQAEGEDGPQLKGDRVTQIARLKTMEKVRLALLGSAFERSILIRDSNKSVALSAIKSPRVKENEVVGYAANRTLNIEVIRYIARRREWTKLYQIKLNLVLNPKTPMASAMAFLGHLHAHDVTKVSRSRNVPSALAQAARRKVGQRK